MRYHRVFIEDNKNLSPEGFLIILTSLYTLNYSKEDPHITQKGTIILNGYIFRGNALTPMY